MSTVPHTLEPVHFSPQTIYSGDCLDILPHFPPNSVDLIYIDPPFNSNRNYEVFWGDTARTRTRVPLMPRSGCGANPRVPR